MTISELELKMLAKEASRKYLEKNISLNETIAKMAAEKQMNGHQVARICEQANLDTYNALWDKSKNGDFSFDVADQNKIASIINSTKSLLLDEYEAPVESIKDLLPEESDVESKTKKEARLLNIAFKKYAELSAPENKISKKVLMKLAAQLNYYAKEIDSAIFEAEVRAKEAELKLKDMLKIAAFDGENLVDIFAAAIIARPEKKAEIRDIFTRVGSELEASGISFSKMAKVYTEDAEGNRITEAAVNNQHALLKHLDTILDNSEIAPRIKGAKEYVTKKIEILNSKILNEKFDNDK